MIRQYRILTKTAGTTNQMLEPGVHGALYNIPEIRDSVAFLENQPNVEMIGIVLGTRFYSIVALCEPELREGHFQLSDLEPPEG